MNATNVSPTVILNGGGMRSLVATASLVKSARPVLLFIHDGRAAEQERYRAFVSQVEHFQIKQATEMPMPHLHTGDGNDKQPMPLSHFQMLTAAAGQAARLNAETMVWPVSVGERFETLSAIAESLVLLEHAVQLEIGRPMKIETPLIELSLRQVVELGRQMSVPWELARSCRVAGDKPCNSCAGCAARAEAFASLGMEDPLVSGAKR